MHFFNRNFLRLIFLDTKKIQKVKISKQYCVKKCVLKCVLKNVLKFLLLENPKICVKKVMLKDITN